MRDNGALVVQTTPFLKAPGFPGPRNRRRRYTGVGILRGTHAVLTEEHYPVPGMQLGGVGVRGAARSGRDHHLCGDLQPSSMGRLVVAGA